MLPSPAGACARRRAPSSREKSSSSEILLNTPVNWVVNIFNINTSISNAFYRIYYTHLNNERKFYKLKQFRRKLAGVLKKK
jgi:hypothetical protein